MEIRKPIPFLDGKYEASSLGNIKEGDKILKIFKQKDGYSYVNMIDNKNIYRKRIHRLVASAFLGLDLSLGRKQCALHKNDIRDDNRIENLYIGTYKDNAIDRSTRGRGNSPRGSHNTASILKENQVIEIKQLLNIGMLNHGQIGNLFGVSRDAIQKISSGKNWKHILIT